MPYKNIIVAVDGSDISNLALKEAIKLAKEQRAKLNILHVVDENFLYYSDSNIDYGILLASLKKEGQEILNKAENIAKQEKIEFEGHLAEIKPFGGRVAEKIIEESKKWPADLLVIGTHGRRGFSRLYLGSVAESVIRTATIPVLLIRGNQGA